MSVPNLKGTTLPLSPDGSAELLSPFPHHLLMEMICVTFKGDPEKLNAWIPAPLEPPDEPGSAAVWVGDLLNVPDGKEDLFWKNPERAKYREAGIILFCKYKGEDAAIVPYLCVDSDWAMVGGWFYGWPKKLGQIYLSQPRDGHFTIPPLGVGSKLRGGLTRHHHNVFDALVDVKMQGDPSMYPAAPFYGVRHWPDCTDPGKLLMNCELVKLHSENEKVHELWVGDAELTFGGNENDNLRDFEPKEVTAGLFVRSTMSFVKAEVVHQYPLDA